MAHSYRLYFRSEKEGILGRHDFVAVDDGAAILIAAALRDACSDICDGFELWLGNRRVDTAVNRVRCNTTQLEPPVQDFVAVQEETLRDSQWAIAKSRRLLEETARLLEQTRRRQMTPER